MSKRFKEWTESLLQALIIVIVLYALLWPVRIDGSSMEPTLSNGDRVAINRVMTALGFYDRGDILVFTSQLAGDNIDIIKRVIGLPGDTVEVHNGQVLVNGELLTEGYSIGKTEGELHIVVPENCVYVLGDNREESTDSRFLGPISKAQIKGRVLLRFFPINEFNLY